MKEKFVANKSFTFLEFDPQRFFAYNFIENFSLFSVICFIK